MMFDNSSTITIWPDSDDSNMEKYIEDLYQLFLQELVRNELPWKDKGMKVSMRRQPEINGRHAIFWHIITGGSSTEENRKLEKERCVRLRWIRSLITRFNDDYPDEKQVRWWRKARGSSELRYVITRPEYDYVVIVDERSEYALLVTAYYVEHNHRRRKLCKEHDRYWAELQKPPG